MSVPRGSLYECYRVPVPPNLDALRPAPQPTALRALIRALNAEAAACAGSVDPALASAFWLCLFDALQPWVYTRPENPFTRRLPPLSHEAQRRLVTERTNQAISTYITQNGRHPSGTDDRIKKLVKMCCLFVGTCIQYYNLHHQTEPINEYLFGSDVLSDIHADGAAFRNGTPPGWQPQRPLPRRQ